MKNHNSVAATARRTQRKMVVAARAATGSRSISQRRALLQLVAAAPLWSGLVALAAPAAAPARRSENGDLTTIARLLAGLSASSNDPALTRILQSPAWREHQRASAAGAEKK